jgi:[ribosomal protein S5]-alanine N-acetyltransferase
MIIFETQRLYARQFNTGDFEDIYSLNSDQDVMQYIRSPQNRDETRQFLEENMAYYIESPQYGRWALLEKTSHAFMGSFMLRPSIIVTGSIEMGYALLKPHWGLGYATELVKEGLIYSFGQLQVPLIIAITHPKNIASQKVLLKAEFDPMGDIMENGRRVNLFQIKNPMHD